MKKSGKFLEGMTAILDTAWKRRKDYVEVNQLEAFRLVTKEELSAVEEVDGEFIQGNFRLPVAVDIYGYGNKNAETAAILQIYDADVLGQGEVGGEELEELKKWLTEKMSVKSFFYKRRYRVKDTPDSGGNLTEQPIEIVVEENGLKFLINLNNYLDTGLFLDHREARFWTRNHVSERAKAQKDSPASQHRNFTVLNLFAYTGSFSVYAAAGGADMTHTVDLSKTYCDWARRNFELNGMAREKHWIYRMDTFEFYKYAARKELRFDLIILDPPTFSRNKGKNFSVQRDHFDLIEGAAALLKPEGEIMFSNNCLDFELDNRLMNRYKIINIQNRTVPLDFRVDPKLAGWDYVPQIHNSYLISLN